MTTAIEEGAIFIFIWMSFMHGTHCWELLKAPLGWPFRGQTLFTPCFENLGAKDEDTSEGSCAQLGTGSTCMHITANT